VSVLSPEDRNPYADLAPGYEGVGEFYDLFADNSDLSFYFEYAKRCGSPILDIAAGTGRVTFALAKQGYEVVALEQSQSMLSAAKKRLLNSPPSVIDRVTLVAGSMIEFELSKTFPLIILPTSFAHALTTENQLSILKCVYSHLRDDGFFIFDIFPGELQYEHATFEDKAVHLGVSHSVSRSGEIHSDPSKKLMRMDLRYTIRNCTGDIVKVTEVVSGAALIFKTDADYLIEESGFTVEEELGDFEGSPYTPESGRRIFVLRKGE
jgi:SAM-dependent methyltransferase